MVNKKICTFTIIAKNYYPQAAALTQSYTKLHPSHKFYVFFIDNDCIESENYQAIAINKIDTIKNLKKLAFKYNITEFSTAVKPAVFLWLMEKEKPQKIFYIDPDIYFYKKLDKIIKILDTHDCALIPHRTKPTNDLKKPNEWDFMGCGYYNLGFVGFKNNAKTRKYINWWGEKLKDYGYSDTKNFMFTDQKWMDYAPSFLNTYIVKDRGYDVAYWNLHEYLGYVKTNKITFFHFSGFIPEKKILSKHQNRFHLDHIGQYKTLFDDYAKILQKFSNTQKNLQSYVYPYNFFDNNVEITEQIRTIYRYLTETEKQYFKKPFSTKSPDSFFGQLVQFIKISKKTKILNYFLLLNKSIPDISREFPLDQPYQEEAILTYLNWCLTFSKKIYNTPKFFLINQAKTTPQLFKKKFNPKFELNIPKTILTLETLKKTKNNRSFVINAYRILLHRTPDDHGFQKNLNDLNQRLASKNLLLYRIIKSQEYNSKNNKTIISLLSFYQLWLLLLICKFFFIDKYLTKSDRSSRHPKSLSYPPPPLNSLKCNISGYIDTESGVGESCRGLIRAFDKAKIPTNLNNIEQEWLRRQDHTYLKRFTKKHHHSVNLICVNADQIESIISTQLGNNYLEHKYNIAYWYWESNIFPERYCNSFNPVNEIWTATNYVQQAISLKSSRPVICLPPSFTSPNPKLIKKFNFSRFNIKTNNRDFLFLNIFDSASIWQRKNPFGLIKSFDRAFKGKNGVKLIIKTTNIKDSQIFAKLKAQIEQNGQIHLIDQYLDPSDYLSLLNSSDCYVNLHRAEGLGIPLINSHLLGKPVIATNFSANIDYQTVSNSFPVDYTPYILKKPIGPYPAHSLWAEPDIEHAAFQMSKVYQMDGASLKKICQRGKEEVGYHFSPQRIADLIKQRLPVINQFF